MKRHECHFTIWWGQDSVLYDSVISRWVCLIEKHAIDIYNGGIGAHTSGEVHGVYAGLFNLVTFKILNPEDYETYAFKKFHFEKKKIIFNLIYNIRD